MGRVLWLTDESPDRNLGGGSIRQAHLLEALGQRVETDLIVAGTLNDDQTRQAVSTVYEVPSQREATAANKTRRRLRDLRLATVEPLPRDVFAVRGVRKAIAAQIRRLDDANGYDMVFVNHQSLMPLLPDQRRAMWVTHPHNVAADRALQIASTLQGARQRWIYQRDAIKSRRLERWAVAAYDAVVVCSEQDADALCGPDRALARGPVVVAPNGVDTSRFTPSALPSEARLVMSASFNYLPNVDGARWFVGEVLPKIQAAVPSVVLDLVGRRPVAEVAALAIQPGINLAADVPLMAPYLSAARVAVVPLRMGTGTRLKALEALAAARPLAGTSVGLDGLGLLDGITARIADDAGSLAQAIVELLTDDDQAGAIGSAGRRLAEERYEWDRIGAEFADALLSLM